MSRRDIWALFLGGLGLLLAGLSLALWISLDREPEPGDPTRPETGATPWITITPGAPYPGPAEGAYPGLSRPTPEPLIPAEIRQNVFVPGLQQGECKIGIAAANGSRTTSAERALLPSSCWFHSWAVHSRTWVDGNGDPVSAEWGEHIPHFWCGNWNNLSTVPGGTAGYDGFLLIFNEPDVPGQCEISPEEAVDRTLRLIETMPRAKMIGPQFFSGLGYSWIRAYHSLLAQQTDWRPYAYAFHYYDWDGLGGGLAAEIDRFDRIIRDEWGEDRRIWLTEYNVHCGPEGLVVDTLAALNDDRIERLAVFAPVWSECLSLYTGEYGNLTLSDLGIAWREATYGQ